MKKGQPGSPGTAFVYIAEHKKKLMELKDNYETEIETDIFDDPVLKVTVWNNTEMIGIEIVDKFFDDGDERHTITFRKNGHKYRMRFED